MQRIHLLDSWRLQSTALTRYKYSDQFMVLVQVMLLGPRAWPPVATPNCVIEWILIGPDQGFLLHSNASVKPAAALTFYPKGITNPMLNLVILLPPLVTLPNLDPRKPRPARRFRMDGRVVLQGGEVSECGFSQSLNSPSIASGYLFGGGFPGNKLTRGFLILHLFTLYTYAGFVLRLHNLHN
jgi:hypothetical protein